MKKLILTLFLLLSISIDAYSMPYEEARSRAWFLTDKMAYELNLTPEQYERAFEINLEYFISVDRPIDSYGNYWIYRDIDFYHVLFDWQYHLYSTLDYFYRPLKWKRSSWYMPIYDRYRKGYFYFNKPIIYQSYKGGTWKHRGPKQASPYQKKKFRPGNGMRDSYNGKHHNKPEYRPEYGRPAPNLDTPKAPNYGNENRNKKQNGKNQQNNKQDYRVNDGANKKIPSREFGKKSDRNTTIEKRNHTQSTNKNSNRKFGR